VNTRQLGPLCIKIGSGATPRGGKDVYTEKDEVALIRSQNVHNYRFDGEGLAYISPEHAEQLRNVEVLPRDVLLNIIGGGSVARVCQVPDDVLPAHVSRNVAIIRPYPAQIDARFLRLFLAGPQMQGHMRGLAAAAAGATRDILTKRMIYGFRLPAMAIGEQREISSILGVLEDKIDLNRRMNQTLEGMVRAVFRDWFMDFGPTHAKMEGRPPYLGSDLWSLFPDSFDEEGKLEGWRSGRLGDVAISAGQVINPESLAPDTPYIGLKHMPRRSVALDDWGGAGKVSSGKLLFRCGDEVDPAVRTTGAGFSVGGEAAPSI
jgi:type I restriction enzyme, S subunit